MARPWRIEFSGAVYHVMSRGNNRRDIFIRDSDYRDFLIIMERAHARFNLQVLAFCLMKNHYHLFLCTPDPNLSLAMHWINTTYTSHFHHRHDTCGHLMQGRYKSVLVADDSHWRHLSAYVHLNPVRAGFVDDPTAYEWSSFREYTRKVPRFDWVRPEEVLAAYGPDDRSRRRNYRRSILALSGKPGSFWEGMRDAVFLGSDEQWERIKDQHPPRGEVGAVPTFRAASQRGADFDAELLRVTRAFGTSPEELLAGRRVGHARIAVYYWLVERCGFRADRVAEYFGVKVSAVSMGMKRFIGALEEEGDELRELMAGLDES